MSGFVEYFYDLCGGEILTAEYNEIGAGATGDFTQNQWKALIAPDTGGKLVIFGYVITAKTHGAFGITSCKVGTKYLGDYYISTAVSHDTSTDDNWELTMLYPIIDRFTIPVTGPKNGSFAVFSTGAADVQSSLTVTYGKIPASRC